jgi:hypothetical protein
MLKRILTVAMAVLFTTVAIPYLPVAGAEEAPESAVSSPPMGMDDPGTPGRYGVEVNFVGSWLRAGAARNAEELLDANYGIGDRIQLKYERPYVSEGEVGSHAQRGMGPTELGVKWRFVDSHGWAAAVYPQYQFDDGFVLKDADGAPEETEGRSVYLPVLLSKSVHERYTIGLNLGFRRNLDHRGDDANFAVGAGRAVGETQRVLAEVYSERDRDLNNRQTDVRVGYVLALFPKRFEKSHFEFPAYASVGHSVGRIEAGERARTVTLGVSVIRKPEGEGE